MSTNPVRYDPIGDGPVTWVEPEVSAWVTDGVAPSEEPSDWMADHADDEDGSTVCAGCGAEEDPFRPFPVWGYDPEDGGNWCPECMAAHRHWGDL